MQNMVNKVDQFLTEPVTPYNDVIDYDDLMCLACEKVAQLEAQSEAAMIALWEEYDLALANGENPIPPIGLSGR